ncbi:hypothetical protein MKL09_04450, partial [Methylobacterium sp. J-048]|nr:hypothetical protein [Methylobacterium sp. J-048]
MNVGEADVDPRLPTHAPHPEVLRDPRSRSLEGGFQGSGRDLEPSFEARRSSISGHLRMRVWVGRTYSAASLRSSRGSG